MKPDRRALAGIFDALIFLSVASLVSVSLLSVLSSPVHDEKLSVARIDAAHAVLLRSTVTDVRGNHISIEEAFKLQGSGERYADNISMALDLLLQGLSWRWTVEDGTRSYAFGDDAVPNGPVYCSVVRAPFNGHEVVFRLHAWSYS